MSLVQEELRSTVSPGEHVIAIGVFDGVHRGHQMLLQKMLSEASRRAITGGVITFYPHPIAVIKPEIKISYLESLACFIGLFVGSLVPFFLIISQLPLLHEKEDHPFTSILIIPFSGIRITKSASPKYVYDFLSFLLIFTG